jgi:hypothetical protein
MEVLEDYPVFIHDIVCAEKVTLFDIIEILKFSQKKKEKDNKRREIVVFILNIYIFNLYCHHRCR